MATTASESTSPKGARTPQKAMSTGQLATTAGGDLGAGESVEKPSTDILEASTRRKKRKPGSTWDGRVGDLSLKEYRERKWGIDAAWGKTARGGPSYSFRASMPMKITPATNTILPINPVESYVATQLPRQPSFSMGGKEMYIEKELSKGPGHYEVKSTMDPKGNPIVARKHTGAKFGTERLQIGEIGTPAPGDYDPEAWRKEASKKKSPAFTTQGREAWAPRTGMMTPDPGEYNIDHCQRNGKHTPIKWTAQGKTEPLAKPRGSRMYIGPGPSHYNPPGAGTSGTHTEHYKQRAPKWRQSSEPRGLL